MALTPVRVTPGFRRRLKDKPGPLREVLKAAILQLRENPRHPGLHTHRVQGAKGVFEARLDGGNRLTFHWEGDTIVLRNHCNHAILKKP